MIKAILLGVLLLGAVACGDDDCDHPPAPPAPAPQPAPDPAPAPQIPLPPDLPIPLPPDLPIPGDPGEPGPTPAPEPVPTPTGELAQLELLINQERASRQLPIVASDAALACAAAKHAADIGPRRTCSHTGGDGSSFSQRVASCGGSLRSGGEIIACGQGSPRAAVDAWLNSPGHRAIMLDGSQRAMGAGMTGNFWVVVFSGG